MPFNATRSANGTTGKRGTPEFQEFTVQLRGYTEDEIGHENCTLDVGKVGIVQAINARLDVSAINTERTRLTSGKTAEMKTSAALWERVQNAKTPEEKLAIIEAEGLR